MTAFKRSYRFRRRWTMPPCEERWQDLIGGGTERRDLCFCAGVPGAATTDVPGCLVLDVRCRALRRPRIFNRGMPRINLEIPIVFITGHGTFRRRWRAMKAGRWSS